MPDDKAPSAAAPDSAAQISLQSRLPQLLPLAVVWLFALLPLAFYVLYRDDAGTAVIVALTFKLWAFRILIGTATIAVLGLLIYPPLPAWLRRCFDRTRTAWSTDRAPLLRALTDLGHFETAQKHYEVARLAWTRSDHQLVAVHAKRSIELDDSLPHAQHLFGQFCLRMNALPQALSAFAAAELLDPGHAFGETLLQFACVQHLQGDRPAALATFARYAKLHGGNHRSNFWHGEALFADGQREAAKQAFQLAAADPKMRLTAEDNWFRARARVRCWRMGSGPGIPSRTGK